MNIGRRTFVSTATTVSGLAAAHSVFGQWQPSQRYPDPAVVALDPSFNRYRLSLAKVEQIATGMRWAEGPVWFGDGRFLLWSDIPNNRIMKWEEQTGAVSVFRQPANNSNGLTRDRQGRLVTCEHLTRRVTRTEYDGSVTVIADRFDGKPLNSPNDVVCTSDGAIWFTDPPYGILGYYEGERATPELPTNVYRWDAGTKTVAVVVGDIERPNGLAFSPDERVFYVVEGGPSPRVIRAYDVVDGGRRLTNRRAFHPLGERDTPDGFRVDVDGNLWCGWGMGEDGLDGVRVINPAGKAIGHISLPERAANLCFGGRHRNRLFMCGSTSVYALYVNTQGAS